MYTSAISKHFAPEFLGRITETFVFDQLSIDERVSIAQLQLTDILDTLSIPGVKITISNDTWKEILDKKITEHRKGGRATLHFIRTAIKPLIVDYHYSKGPLVSDKNYEIVLRDNELLIV